ncbi:MAG: phosphotransferase, partial [Blastococcus sp.]|nr:phosphotransferase [Blastococcus sp.]
PWTMAAQARVLAGLHRAVHAVPAPDWLPALGDGGTALLHLDLHPDNVLLGAGGPVVIDWTNAARGPAEVDVADAWLVISTGNVPGGRLQTAVVGAAQGTFARLFRRAAGLDLEPGLPAAANRRLGDRNLNDRERQRVRRLAGLSES